MATQLNTTNHDALNTEMTNHFRSGTCCGVKISIYTDAEATAHIVTIVTVLLKIEKISQILKTASYVNPTTNQTVKANVKIVFADGSTLIKL